MRKSSKMPHIGRNHGNRFEYNTRLQSNYSCLVFSLRKTTIHTDKKKITSTKFDIEQRTMNNLGAILKPKCEMRVKKLKIFETN